MNKSGILGDALGQLGSTVKQIGKTVVKTPGGLAKTAVKQVGLPEAILEKEKKRAAVKVPSEKNTEEFVKNLYGPTEKQDRASMSHGSKAQTSTADQAQAPHDTKSKTPEELEKIEKLRQELHQTTYYQPLVNRPRQQEERQAAKVEREEKEKRWELQEKDKKKPKPLAVSREQNKAEQFRGTSG